MNWITEVLKKKLKKMRKKRDVFSKKNIILKMNEIAKNVIVKY